MSATHRIVQQVEPVVEVVDKRECIRDVVTLRTEQEQHSQREIFFTTVHSIQQTESNHTQW